MIINVDIKDFKKVEQAMQELVNNVGKPFEQVIEGGGQEIRKEAVRSIQQDPKSGIIYQRYNPRRRHQASAKGEAPASDTGFLVSQITMNVREKTDGSVVGQIISAAPYSAHLEYGTTNMTERPFMQPALEKNRRKIHSMFKKGVLK
jgi:HK97 gp10 family phage protein